MSDNSLQKQVQLLAENVNTSIYNQRKYLLGRVLTIVDAVADDSEQRKAIKDLVHDLFHQGSYWNDIKWHFNQFGDANGYKKILGDDTVLELEGSEPKNIYKDI